MTERDVWLYTYISVMAIRLHPRNDGDSHEDDVEDASVVARMAAFAAVGDLRELAPLST